MKADSCQTAQRTYYTRKIHERHKKAPIGHMERSAKENTRKICLFRAFLFAVR